MCVAAIAPALAIAQGVAGYAAAGQAADQQNAYYTANRNAAIAAADDSYASNNAQLEQKRAAAVQDLQEKQTAAIKARATAAVSAGESGVNGLSVDALQSDLFFQQGQEASAIETNYRTDQLTALDQGQSIYNQTISRINSVRQAASPSPIPFALSSLGNIYRKDSRNTVGLNSQYAF